MSNWNKVPLIPPEVGRADLLGLSLLVQILMKITTSRGLGGALGSRFTTG